MPTPQITITPAGFAAIVNAENTGTAPVKITQVGLTAQHFDVATVGAAVPNESKRLTTFGGKAIADDTLHLNVRDDSQDTYTLRGFGLYLEGGTLFAVYSQATPIMEKAAAATMLLATDIRFTNITTTSIEVGDVDFINPPASTTQLGVVRLATDQEADGGADHTTAITPRGLAGYINRRFGTGAPSTFVKGLLGAATAALFRVELGLKSAATRDEGHGNGLNADLLDGEHGGYYLDWRNHTNRPLNFPPAVHSHTIAQVSGLQAALESKQPAGNYATSDHAHNIANVTGLQSALDATWSKGTNGATLSSTSDDLNSFTGFHAVYAGSSAGNRPGRNVAVIGFGTGGYTQQIALRAGIMQFRSEEASKWGEWLTVVTQGDGITSTAGDILCSKTNAVVGVGAAGGRNGGICNVGNNGVGDVAIFSEHASGTVRVRPNGRTSTVGQTLFTNTGMTISGTINPAGGYDYGSSRKLKDIDGPMPYGLSELRRINTLIGKYKPEYNDDDRKRLFFDAEQFAEVMPEVVDIAGVEFNGERVPSIKLDQVMPPAYRAIAQLADIVDALAEQVATLRSGQVG